MAGLRYVVPGPGCLGRVVLWVCNPYRLVFGLFLVVLTLEKGL